MIYLDANTFYWYYGRDKLPLPSSVPNLDVSKLRIFLEARTDKSLPASVFMEMIVHFRDDPETIKKIISFREEKKMQIYNNFHGYCFTPDELTLLHFTADKVILKKYAYKLLNKKIEIEVQHAYLFLQEVSLLYANHYLKSVSELDDKTKGNVLWYIGKELSSEMKDEYMRELTDSLKNGYDDNNKSQQYLKNKYMELLVQSCIMYRIIIDTIVKFFENEHDLYAIMCKSAADARANGFTDRDMMRIIVAALAEDAVFMQEAKVKIPAIFVRKGYSIHQAEYMRVLLEAWLERGQKLRKNDIFDMLYVGAVDKQVTKSATNVLIDQSSYLLSFDKTLLGFICQNEWNKILLNKFLLPEYQR